MAPAIETDRKPTSGIELAAKVQRALERPRRIFGDIPPNRYVNGYLWIVA